MFGQKNWEAAESELQRRTALLNLEKGGYRREDVRYLFAGDLLGQSVATSFGVMELEIPLFGLYGACSTMGEALGLAAMTVSGGFAEPVETAPEPTETEEAAPEAEDTAERQDEA